VKKVFKICTWIWCWKIKLKRHRSQKTPFHVSLPWNEVTIFKIWNCPNNELNVILRKSTLMNQCHWNKIFKILAKLVKTRGKFFPKYPLFLFEKMRNFFRRTKPNCNLWKSSNQLVQYKIGYFLFPYTCKTPCKGLHFNNIWF